MKLFIENSKFTVSITFLYICIISWGRGVASYLLGGEGSGGDALSASCCLLIELVPRRRLVGDYGDWLAISAPRGGTSELRKSISSTSASASTSASISLWISLTLAGVKADSKQVHR